MNIHIDRKKLVVVAALLVLVVLLAGCGASTNSSTNTSTPATTTSPTATIGAAANSQFTSCLKTQGVTLPARPARPSGQGAPQAPQGAPQGQQGQGRPPGQGFGQGLTAKQQAALAKCRQYLPAGAGRGGPNGNGGANPQALAKYTACLKSHGVKLTGQGPLGGADTTTPAFQKAAKACSQFVPQGSPGTPPATTTTP